MAFDNTLILRAPAALTIAAAATPRAQSVVGSALELAGGGLPITGTASMVVTVATAEADATLNVAFEISVDGGTNYREVADVVVPCGFKGQFAVPIGRVLRVYRYAAANVQCRAVFYNLTNAAFTAITVGAYLTSGETDISGKTPADVLLV